jgi:hypothetical protein
MSEKTKNESNAKTAFDQRVKESKQKAIEENVKNAEKTGNVLTQTVDENGNLIGVNNANTQEFALRDQESISTADICNELFEGENIIVGNNDQAIVVEIKSTPPITLILDRYFISGSPPINANINYVLRLLSEPTSD